MRDLLLLDKWRLKTQEVLDRWGSYGGSLNGCFMIPVIPTADVLRVIASVGDGWDHVSVSLEHRCPTWDEMSKVKRMFFNPWETAVQFHVPEEEHINIHPNVLHLWRPHNQVIHLPPRNMV